MQSGAIKSASRTGRHVPRRLCQSRDVLLENSALGTKPEDETEQKCAIPYIGIFMALSHWRAMPHLAMHVNERPLHLEAAVEIAWSEGPKWVVYGSSGSRRLRYSDRRPPTSRFDYQQARMDGRRISSASAESVANHLINRRLSKRQRMRWSLKGAHYLLQTRVELFDGRLEHCFLKRLPQFRSPEAVRC